MSSANLLVVVILPLISIIIVEDQVKYLRPLGVKAGYVEESKTSDQEISSSLSFYYLYKKMCDNLPR